MTEEKHDVCEIAFEPVNDETIKKILSESKVIAIVGMSSDPGKPSHAVGKYLMESGYEVIPVNPTVEEIIGLKAYHSLKEIPKKVDVVDIFRNPKDVPPIVDEAIEIGAKTVWMQEGIVNNAAAIKAEEAGLTVVMDRCMEKAHMAMQAH
jgi:uncharacterized protein